jgi:hypothetical protein
VPPVKYKLGFYSTKKTAFFQIRLLAAVWASAPPGNGPTEGAQDPALCHTSGQETENAVGRGPAFGASFNSQFGIVN